MGHGYPLHPHAVPVEKEIAREVVRQSLHLSLCFIEHTAR